MLITQLPDDSALRRAQLGEDATWTLDRQLFASIADALNIANWQRAGDKKVPRPKQIPRPGVSDSDATTKRLGTARPKAVIDAILKRAQGGG